MSKKISVGAAIVLMLLAAVLSFQITYLSVDNKYSNKLNQITEGRELYEKLLNVDETFRQLYVGEIDDKTIQDTIISGYVYGTGDKYATYMTKEQYESFLEDSSGEQQGIGVFVLYNSEFNAIEVISVLPDSPALEAGMKPGDLIYMVDGIDVSSIGFYGAVSKIKGNAGSEMQLSVLRAPDFSEPIEFTVKREYITEMSVLYKIIKGTDVGYINILEFDDGTPKQFRKAVDELIYNGAARFVFDVRFNPGGNLDSIGKILDYLLPEGPIIRTVDKSGDERALYSSASELDYPMVVLINENTASAAELFAAALKDYNKATLVGVTTYGKGTMQTVVKLPDNSALSVSYRMYSPPFSDNYEGIGVIPDVEVVMADEVKDKSIYTLDEKLDTQLQAGIKVLLDNIENP